MSDALPLMQPAGDATVARLERVDFSFGERAVLHEVSFSVPRGAVTALIGPMGSGKTTTLRLLGGLLQPDRGAVAFEGQVLGGLGAAGLYALRARMGMMFQFGALFADLSVFDNVAFPLREHTQLEPALVRDIVLMKLQAVGLRGARDLRPSDLSGGMMRRVALARAMALDPEFAMYDEPFSGLDPISMRTVANLIRQLNDSMGLSTLFVSHELDETLRIADHVVVLSDGRVIAQGSPQALRESGDPMVVQYLRSLPDGPVGFHYPRPAFEAELGQLGASS